MKICFESSDSSYSLNPAYLEHQPTCEDVETTQDPRTNGFSKGKYTFCVYPEPCLPRTQPTCEDVRTTPDTKDSTSSVITTRIRRVAGGYVFTGVCLSNFGEGGSTPIQLTKGGGPHPADGGYPIPGLDRGVGGYPIQGPDEGVLPSQISIGGGYPNHS